VLEYPQQAHDLDEQAIQTFYLAMPGKQRCTRRQHRHSTLLARRQVQAIVNQNAIVVRGTPDELLLRKAGERLDRRVPKCGGYRGA